jgi:P27 family predicted phage terminase small subunit
MKRVLITKSPSPPAHLCRIGKAVWKRTCDYLVARGLLHHGDLSTVEAHSAAFARLHALEAAIRTEPISADGKPHPCHSAANTTAATVTKLGSMLGLGPVTRGRLGAEARHVETPVDDESGWGSVVRLPRAR